MLAVTVILYVGIKGLATVAKADGGIDIEKTFPDDNFRQYVSDNFDTVKDGKLSESEIAAVTSIEVDSFSDLVDSIKGIEVFTGLKSLTCRGLDMPCIDLSKNTALTSANFTECRLDVLDVSKNTKLEHLSCIGNRIRVLDVSKNTLLRELYCTFNELTSLDVSNNTKLEQLSCAGNPIQNLDVSMLPNLSELYCGNMSLTSLDVSHNTKLGYLDCSANQLSSLDISKNAELRRLDCSYNDLQSLNISKNTKLQNLDCVNNRIRSLSFVNNTILQHLYCGGNLLSSLNLTKNTMLSYLECEDNRLTSLDLTKNTMLHTLLCGGNRLTSLDLSKNTKLMELRCYSNKLTNLNLEANQELYWLNCLDNPLATIVLWNTDHYGSWDPFYIPVGTKVTLRMPELSKPAAKYQWQQKPYEGGTWKNSNLSGAATDTLQFTFTKGLSKYALQCLVYDSNDKLIDSYDCQIAGGPVVLNSNGRYADWPYEYGDEFEGKVKVVGKQPLSYQWQVKKNDYSDWINASAPSAKTADFHFALQSGHNGMEIGVIITDPNGLTETVGIEDTEWYLNIVPKVTKEPADVYTDAGKTVKFSVDVTGTKTYQWQSYNPKKGVWVNCSAASAKTATLSFTAQTGHDGMRFRCLVDGYVYSRSALLSVSDDTLRIIEHPKDTTVEVGQAATFTVVARGKGTLKYQWYAFNPKTQTWVASGSPSAKTATLVITAQTGHHYYRFRCVVTDSTGKKVTSNAAILKVKPTIKVQPKNKTVNVGQTAEFKVQALGATPLSYQWQTYDTTLKRWVDCTAASAKTATLSFTAVKGHNGKKFRCVVTDANKMSTPSNGATLTVK